MSSLIIKPYINKTVTYSHAAIIRVT